MSRIGTKPPLKADGTLDYAQFTLTEICEDLTESLLNRIQNSQMNDLLPFLEALPPSKEIPEGAMAPTPLVQAMESLLRLEGEEVGFRSTASREVLGLAVREIRAAACGLL